MPTNVVQGQRVSPEKLARAKFMRRNMTYAERCFWSIVRADRLLGLHFRRQQIIDGFTADFYCHRLKLVVEIDGGIHESQKDSDALRERVIRKRGLSVVRFTNEEVTNRPDCLERRIADLTLPSPTGRGGEATSRLEREPVRSKAGPHPLARETV